MSQITQTPLKLSEKHEIKIKFILLQNQGYCHLTIDAS